MASTYRVKREYTSHLVPLGVLVWKPVEAVAQGTGQRLIAANELVEGKGLAREAAGERVPTSIDGMATISFAGYKLSYGDVLRGV